MKAPVDPIPDLWGKIGVLEAAFNEVGLVYCSEVLLQEGTEEPTVRLQV